MVALLSNYYSMFLMAFMSKPCCTASFICLLNSPPLGRVLGTQDTVVWPREGEWWGAMDPSDPFGKVLPMNETRW